MEDLGLGHHFLSKLDELYKHTDLCDVILKATPGGAETDTGSIHLHSVILAAHSPAFRTLFTKEKAGRSRWTLFVRHESLEHWRTLVKFMYRGNLDINNHNVDVVCNLAQSYNIKRAVVLCEKFKTANRDVMYISSVNSNKQHYVSMQDVLSLKDSECDEVVDGPILRPDDSQQSDHADDSVEKRLVYNVDILYSNAYTCSGKRDRDHSQHQSCDGNEAPNTNEKKQLEGQEICKTCKYSEREDKSQSEYKENSAEMSTSLSHNSSSRRPPQDSVFPTNTQISENTDTSPVHELLDNCGISLKMEVEEQDMFGNGYSVNDDSISVSGREEDRGNTFSTTDDRECRQRKEPEIHVRGGQLSAVTEGDDQSSQITHGSPGIKQEQIWLQHTAPNEDVNHVSFDQTLISSSTMSTSQDHSGMRCSAAVGEGMKNPSYLCSHSGFLGSNDNRLAMPTCHTHNNPLPPASCGCSELNISRCNQGSFASPDQEKCSSDMTNAERCKMYRERLKFRPDCEEYRKINALRCRTKRLKRTEVAKERDNEKARMRHRMKKRKIKKQEFIVGEQFEKYCHLSKDDDGEVGQDQGDVGLGEAVICDQDALPEQGKKDVTAESQAHEFGFGGLGNGKDGEKYYELDEVFVEDNDEEVSGKIVKGEIDKSVDEGVSKEVDEDSVEGVSMDFDGVEGRIVQGVEAVVHEVNGNQDETLIKTDEALDGRIAEKGSKQEYSCSVCQKTYSRLYSLTRHMRSHTNEGPECFVCKRRFATQDVCQRHISSVHEGIKWPCTIEGCEKVFQTKGGLNTHKKSHENCFRYICPHCGIGYNYKSAYESHVGSHTGEKSYQCKICQKLFGHVSNFRQHTALCGKSNKTLSCPLCPAKFKVSRYVREHIASVHVRSDKFQCTLCGKCFNHRASFFNHKKTKH